MHQLYNFAVFLLLGTTTALPNLSLFRRDDITAQSNLQGYYQCTSSQTADINKAWADARRLSTIASGFWLDWKPSDGTGPPGAAPPAHCTGICTAGVLEKRYWGDDISSQTDAIPFIRSTYSQIDSFLCSVYYSQLFSHGQVQEPSKG